MVMLTTNKRESLDIFGATLHPEKYFLYPNPEDAADQLVDYYSVLRQNDVATTLADGAFDVPHANHEGYLRHCRLLGAESLLNAHDITPTREAINATLLSDGIHLAVTVDADAKVANKKSGAPGKGGVERPIYPWQARAERVAGYIFELDNKLRRTVDLTTVEGDPAHIGTPFESSLELAGFLKDQGLLDTFIIFGEHTETIDEADRMGLRPLVIPNEDRYFINPQTNEPYSSSALIARAQGGTVKHATTSPIDGGSL